MRFILVFFSSLLLFPLSSGAYGWGFVKAKDGSKPDVGIYGAMIEDHQAFYMDHSDEKVVYLTFDNGYEAGYTTRILDVLEQEEVPATFFVTGHYVKEEADLMRQMVEAGHTIGNHSYSHPDFTQMDKDEIAIELNKLEQLVGQETRQKQISYVRPPRGTFDESTLEIMDELGYIQVFWSVAFKDWEQGGQKGWEYAYDQIMSQIHPGAILLLHAVSEDNAQALERVIKQLKKDGYRFESLDYLTKKRWIDDYMLF